MYPVFVLAAIGLLTTAVFLIGTLGLSVACSAYLIAEMPGRQTFQSK